MAFALIAAGACGDDPEPIAPAEPVDITLSETSVTLIRSVENPNPTTTVAAEVKGTSNTDLVWKVHNPAIATVSQTGVITGRADGQTFVTAVSAADPTKNRSVVVNVVSTIVRVNPPQLFAWAGGPTRQVTHTVENNANKAVTWRSSNEAVATVSATGVVTPIATGTANIIARSVADPSKEAFSAILVDPAPSATYRQLTSGVPVTGLSAATDAFGVYGYIIVPAGSTKLTVELNGPNGDADLYLRRGAPNATPSFCVSGRAASVETCTANDPQPRIYYVLIHAYEGYSDLTLTATVTP